MKVYYSDPFEVPLPEGHRFPIEKYRILRERLCAAPFFEQLDLEIPPPAVDRDLLLVHQSDYLEKVKYGTLSAREIRRLGLPWAPALVERARRSVGGTIAACTSALEQGVAVNLAGGTHHAFPDHGEGFCVFNDAAVAARVLQRDGLIRQILILDTDVHQGNGTAAIFSGDPSVFTFSIHGEKNFPFRKHAGDLDIGLVDGAADEEFLAALEAGIARVFIKIKPQLVIYLAGADPYAGDRLGRLALSKKGLDRRDQLVYQVCRERAIPNATVMAGGYAIPVEETVDIQFNTVKQALDHFEEIRG